MYHIISCRLENPLQKKKKKNLYPHLLLISLTKISIKKIIVPTRKITTKINSSYFNISTVGLILITTWFCFQHHTHNQEIKWNRKIKRKKNVSMQLYFMNTQIQAKLWAKKKKRGRSRMKEEEPFGFEIVDCFQELIICLSLVHKRFLHNVQIFNYILLYLKAY